MTRLPTHRMWVPRKVRTADAILRATFQLASLAVVFFFWAWLISTFLPE